MSAARSYADELLARFTDPAPMVIAESPHAKPAKAAKTQHSCGLAADSTPCEGLRISANPAPDSQTFAGLRSPADGPQSEKRRGLSQDSQDSQGAPGVSPTSAPAAATGEIPERPRVVWRLLRWGWPEAEAHALADRITQRDLSDDRRTCVECHAYRPGRCGNSRQAGLSGPVIGKEWAGLDQRCPGFGATA